MRYFLITLDLTPFLGVAAILGYVKYRRARRRRAERKKASAALRDENLTTLKGATRDD